MLNCFQYQFLLPYLEVAQNSKFVSHLNTEFLFLFLFLFYNTFGLGICPLDVMDACFQNTRVYYECAWLCFSSLIQ